MRVARAGRLKRRSSPQTGPKTPASYSDDNLDHDPRTARQGHPRSAVLLPPDKAQSGEFKMPARLTINLITSGLPEVIELPHEAHALAALAARNLTPKGDPRHGQVFGTFGIPVGTYTIRLTA